MKTLTILFLLNAVALAQVKNATSTLRGTIKDYRSAQPLVGAIVFAKNTALGAVTDSNGDFSLTVPAGTYDLRISMLGYEELSLDGIKTRVDAVTTIDTTLKEKDIEMQEVVIAPPEPEKANASGLTARLDRNMVMSAPGSAQDIFWTLQTLPGVSSGSDQSKLYVRGGDPSENLVLFDGAIVPNPYHFEIGGGGAFSVFDSRLIDHVEFYEGGFPARYGDRLSSVLAITNRTAGRDSLRGEVNLSLTDLNGMVEFPLNDLNGSGFLSVRRSYFDVLVKLLPGLADRTTTATPYFYDYTVKLDFDLSRLGKLTLTGLNSYENMYANFDLKDYSLQNGPWNLDGWTQSFGATLHTILSDNTGNEFNSYYSKDLRENRYPQNSYENYDFREYGFKDDVTLMSGSHEVHLGGWLIFKNQKASADILAAQNILTFQNYYFQGAGATALLSAYAEDKVKVTDAVSLNAGLRYDHLDGIGKGVLSPRFNAVDQWNDHMSVSLEYGWYYQSPNAYQIAVDPSLEFEKAENVGIGMKHQLSDKLTLDVELYNKKYSNLVVDHSDGTLSSDGFGFARGAEIYVKMQPDDHLVGWISYAYSLAKRKAGILQSEQLFDYDRTHLVSAVVDYRLARGWSIGGQFRYGTGTPYTPVIGSTHDQGTNSYDPIFGPQNSARFPDYSRLDVRLTRSMYLMGIPFKAYVEVLNVFNSQNAIHWMYSDDYTQKKFMTFFTITPTIGLNAKI